MERTSSQGGEPQPRLHEPADRVTDEQLILHGITEALREERPIDHATARAIAAQLHGGQTSPLYALASSGALVDTRQALLQRINAAGVRTLGEVATVDAHDQDDEPDSFPWVDAATWSPSEVVRGNYEERR